MVDRAWVLGRMKDLGVNQTDLAKLLGRNRSAVTHLLNGSRDLKAQEIPTVAKFLDMPVDRIVNAFGMKAPTPVGQATPRDGIAVAQLTQKRAALIAEIEAIDKAIEIMRR